MPQIPKHRKVKRATVLIKKTQCLKSYHKNKFYKPLCEKLKSNNNLLAKALSKEKQESQLLFSQNVALIAEVQDLGLACSKRDAVISNILKNAKEMLKMLVTITGYLTNTISSCQEFAASSVTNLQMSCHPAGRRESYRRLSTKSPTRGVVKPMVSGHTITKPTINLSRVNMQHINNPSNLSIIQEVTTPPRNQDLNSSRSPVSVPMRQHRRENGRACRMPERLIVVSPRNNGENERRLSKRSSRNSERISEKRSRPKSDRLSGDSSSRHSIENFKHIGSPRVKLNDVSKLLQNSQSINIRLLTKSRNDETIVSPENSSATNQEDSQSSITIPETPPSDDSKDNNDNIVSNRNEQIDNELSSTSEPLKKNSNKVQNLTSNWEDPLEGPSWLFNNSQTVPSFTNSEEKTDNVNVLSNVQETSNVTELSDMSDNEKSMEEISLLSTLSKRGNQMHNSKKSKQINNRNECIGDEENRNDETICNISTSTGETNVIEEEYKIENEPTKNLSNFVTQRRRYFESEDEDDFTLMYMRQPQDMHFDINDLKLPVLEESALKSVAPVEPEPEITATIQKISQICQIPSASNSSLDESAFNRSTVKLPLLMNNDYENKDLTLLEDKSKSLHLKKRMNMVATRESAEYDEDMLTLKKKSNQKKKKKKKKDKSECKDPSTVKVVLQKLNESDVKSRTPSPEETSRNPNQSLSPVSLRVDNSSDAESSNTSTSSVSTLNRPKRKRILTSFQEPSLRTKLRRN